jgi:hypothetical protein
MPIHLLIPHLLRKSLERNELGKPAAPTPKP